MKILSIIVLSLFAFSQALFSNPSDKPKDATAETFSNNEAEIANGNYTVNPVSPKPFSVIFVQGKASAAYDNLFGKPDQKFVEQAKQAAVIDAISRALENQPEGLRSHFKSAASKLSPQVLMDRSIITERRNDPRINQKRENDGKRNPFFDIFTTERNVDVVFTGSLDITALRDFLNSIPKEELQNQAQLSDALVAVFFTVRETSGMTIFDAERKTDSAAATTDAMNKESEGGVEESENGVSQSETSIRQEKSQIKTTASGSTTIRTDKAQYTLDDISKELFGDGLKARFTSKGINEIFDGAMFESAEQLDEVYGAGESIRSKNWKAVTEDIANEEPSIQYLIVGTMDFSYPTDDPVTGMPMYSGTVSGKVYKLREPGKMPTTVGGLAPLEAKFSAPTQQDAKKRVVAKLSELAADEIISFLNQKGIL
jgi:hypothetical protein